MWESDLLRSHSAFIVFHCLLNWLWGHVTWRHGRYLVVTQQNSILDVLFRCAVRKVRRLEDFMQAALQGFKNSIRGNTTIFTSWIVSYCRHHTQFSNGFPLNDNIKLLLNGGTYPTLLTVIKNYWFHCISTSVCISFPARYTINECPRCFDLLEAGTR